MKKQIIILFLIFFTSITGLVALPVATYGVADEFWTEELGSQRAVVSVDSVGEKGQDIKVVIPWRLKKYPRSNVTIIQASSGMEITKRSRGICNSEYGTFFFKAPESGTYYIYYLNFKPYNGHGSFLGRYIPYSPKGYIPFRPKEAEVVKIESRSSFDNFYPMEVCQTKKEKLEFTSALAKSGGDFALFPEDRELPIRMKGYLPHRWLTVGESSQFKMEAMQNEYRSYQIGVYAFKKELINIQVQFSDLTSEEGSLIPIESQTCFNLGGIDPYGKSFSKTVNLPYSCVQALWMGIDIPEEQKPGRYTGTLTFTADNAAPKTIELTLDILDSVIADRGDSEPWRHSRLRWLNSTMGLERKITKPYTPVQMATACGIQESCWTFNILDRQISIAKNGLPTSILVNGTQVLSSPINLELKKGCKTVSPIGESQIRLLQKHETEISWVATTLYDGFSLVVNGSVGFDGYCKFETKIVANKTTTFTNIKLSIPWEKSNAKYLMGMNQPGRAMLPTGGKLREKWIKPQDAFFIGSAQAGMLCELLGATYSGPLLNLYRPAPPKSWHNGGLGSLKLDSFEDKILTEVTTGIKTIGKGKEENYDFSLIVTPVKPMDPQTHFKTRYFHSPNIDTIDPKYGVNVVNLHHANEFNPYINYPFIVPEKTKEFVNRVHEKGMKMKIYYTVRELTSLLPELWAIRSLGDEILPTGRGGGYTWLREHLEDDYSTQWYAFNGGEDIPDAALLTSGVSRWYNYYIEGLNYMLKNFNIDGLYLDDVAFDRTMLQRIRRVMEANKEDCLIDLHSNTGFSKGPAIQYTEFFPYVDKIWFGESFRYDHMSPENWLVESSGIPFGLMGDTLQFGGHPWKGLVFGMTNRLPWGDIGADGDIATPKDPRLYWPIFDERGLSGAQMYGWWDENPLVTLNTDKAKATLYWNKEEGKGMLAIASWANVPINVKIDIDWNRIGVNEQSLKAEIPKIDFFQEAENQFIDFLSTSIPVQKGKVIYFSRK